MTAQPAAGDLTTFGSRLRHAMRQAGHGRRWLAKRSGISLSWIRELLANRSRSACGGAATPGSATVLALANALGVSPSWLLFGEGGII